jgi:hypothetical protein
VGQVPATLVGERVVVSRGVTPVAYQSLTSNGASYRFSLAPGHYALSLFGPVGGNPPSNVAVVRSGKTTHKDLVLTVSGSGPG